MDLNREPIEEMIISVRQIDTKISSILHLQKAYPEKWNLMLKLNAMLKQLKAEREWLWCMLEDEYDQMEISKILAELNPRI